VTPETRVRVGSTQAGQLLTRQELVVDALGEVSFKCTTPLLCPLLNRIQGGRALNNRSRGGPLLWCNYLSVAG
jgi:hypothetical protein